MKEEIVDEGYEAACEWPSLKRGADEEESVLVAKRIKQELTMNEKEKSDDRRKRQLSKVMPQRQRVEIIEDDQRYDDQRIEADMIRSRIVHKEPLVFDHFICMRIGLNSKNNVQKLMALLTAHNFIDLTVMPSTVSAPPPPPPPPVTLLPPQIVHITAQPGPSVIQSVSSLSSGLRRIVNDRRDDRHIPRRHHINRRVTNGSPTLIPTVLKCTKCKEVMGSGATFNSVLSHVQKAHLKMAAFQCRICKQYRTTQERIQSHVTTVHKARSTKFDDSLAGPLSSKDMQAMEQMIHTCFPSVQVKLEITDRLSVRSFEMIDK